MIEFTFRHLRGIGKKRERDLWRSGIVSWNDLESRPKDYEQLSLWTNFPTRPPSDVLASSRQALKEENADFFAEHLPRREYYRIALTFFSKTLFLDIETTGLSRFYNYITLVGWSMGGEYSVYIRGDDDSRLRKALSRAKAIVTFNGSLFDLPFLAKEFADLTIPSAHVDLRFVARRLGLSGGQKKIETLLGIERPAEIAELDGSRAPLLWYRYCRSDLDALRLLIEYNYADIKGMHAILDALVERLRSVSRFSEQTCQLNLASEEEDTLEKGHRNGGRSTIRIRPYEGILIMPLRELLSSYDICPSRFVGIDLTGSEDRPSGWCFLEGDTAYTRMISSDSDLVRSITEVKPHLVSIDSPLSLPAGRVTVNDDDPGREIYGIMRHCERILKKRGVNVYPCLIKSMQRLTARGIRLAEDLRSLGVPVIESFPGAAQDIMQMPRKRTDVDFLKRALGEFGVKGEYLAKPVRHDELDAITCAIVGCFFWAGRFEALGNEDEEYLMIPDLSASTGAWGGRKVVGFSGPISTGKTTAARLLEEWGFYYSRYSLMLAGMLRERGLKVDRMALQKIGEEVHKDPGQRWLCWQLVRELPTDQDVAIDGLRHPEDYAFMVEMFGPTFTHVYIDSPTHALLDRFILDGGSQDDFAGAMQRPVEANVGRLATLAHTVVRNCGTLDEFRQKVLACIQTSQAKNRRRRTCR